MAGMLAIGKESWGLLPSGLSRLVYSEGSWRGGGGIVNKFACNPNLFKLVLQGGVS